MEVVQSRYGQLIASRNDIYVGRGLFEYGEFSEGEVEFFRQIIKPEHVVCDVGANIGAHTLAFSRLAKHVHAFEPQPLLYSALCGMVALNELKNVTAVHAGCAAREGTMTCPDLAYGILNNFGAGSLEPYSGERPIRVTRLVTPCDFLKIDVEGMEIEVLKGAAEMIRARKPVLYVEADRREKFDALMEYIRQLGYHPYWHTPALYREDNFFGKKEDIWGGVHSLNVACFPVEVPHFIPATTFPQFAPKEWTAQLKEMELA